MISLQLRGTKNIFREVEMKPDLSWSSQPEDKYIDHYRFEPVTKCQTKSYTSA